VLFTEPATNEVQPLLGKTDSQKEGFGMNEKGIRLGVIAIDLFEAASAFIGAVGLLVGFMNIPVSALSSTPFTDFTVPALLLGVVVGGSALIAALFAVFGARPLDTFASAGAGCITIGYLVVEIALIGLGSWAQIVWLLVGLVMVVMAYLLWQAETQPNRLSRQHQTI
jgi:hypothetical protein